MATFKGPDAGLRKLVRDHLTMADGWWWSGIESGSTAAGLPDSHFCHRSRSTTGWVECKRTDGNTIKFEPHQVAWLRFHSPHCRTFVLVRTLGVASSGGTGDGLAIFRGGHVDELVDGGVEGAPSLLRISGPARKWSWAEIGEILTGA